MAIQVGGTTVIDNSRNLVGLKSSGNYVPLVTVAISGSPTFVSIDLASYGLNASSCDYQGYRIVLDRVTCSQAAAYFFLHSANASNTVNTTGWGSTAGGTTQSRIAIARTDTPFYTNSITDFMIPHGYNSSSGIANFCSISAAMRSVTQYFIFTGNTFRYIRVQMEPPTYYTMTGGNIRLYGLVK